VRSFDTLGGHNLYDLPMNELVGLLVDEFGQRYSRLLGINLDGGKDEEIFKWFLAFILFGAPINEASVIKTFNFSRRRDVLTPGEILETGWDDLVRILDEGAYTRYDFKTSDKLLEIMRNLNSEYKGSLNALQGRSEDTRDLEKRLKDLGKGVGDVTVGIFLRELRDIWEKADPAPTPLVILAAENLGIIKGEKARKVLQELRIFWQENGPPEGSFIEFETALLRVGKDFCRKNRCEKCLLKPRCPSS